MKIKKMLLTALTVGMLSSFGISGQAADNGTIQQGITIGGVDVSGMTEDAAKAAVEAKVETMKSDVITIQIGSNVTQASVGDLGISWDNTDVIGDAADLGMKGNLIQRYKDKKDLLYEPHNFQLNFRADETAVRTFIENECKPFEQERVDGTIEDDGYGGFNIVEGTAGTKINVDASVTAVLNYIKNEWHGGNGSVTLVVEEDPPRGNMEELSQIQDCLGSATTYYTVGDRGANVEIGTQKVSGHLLYPGEEFSVTEQLVPFTAENGYNLAPEYNDGRVVNGYGGGICQVSTTLYNALLDAEIEIIERHNHTYSVSYVDASMDAAIAEGIMDLRFRNNYDTPIFISGNAYGGTISFYIYGKETRPADRTVSYYSTIESVTEPEGYLFFAATDQPVGYLYQVQSAHSGMTATLWKVVTENGETTETQVNTSYYQPMKTGYEVGVLLSDGSTSSAMYTAIASGDLNQIQSVIATGSLVSSTPTYQPETWQVETWQSDPYGTEGWQTETWETEGWQTETWQSDPYQSEGWQVETNPETQTYENEMIPEADQTEFEYPYDPPETGYNP